MKSILFAAALAGSFARAETVLLTCVDHEAGVTVRGRYDKNDGYYLASGDFAVVGPDVEKSFYERTVGVGSRDEEFTLEAGLDDGSSVRIHHQEGSTGGDRMEIRLRGVAGGTFKHDTKDAVCDFDHQDRT